MWRQRLGILPRPARRLVAAGLLMASAVSPAAIIIMGNDLPSEPMPLQEEDKRYLQFGEVVYDYYADRRFDSLTRLLVNQKTGLFNENTEYAELILGDLYVNFGLPDQANTIFNRLLNKDILAQTRAETWFHKAMLEYRRGRFEKAAEVLASDRANGLPEHLEAQRHLVLANIRIGQEEFGEALASLHAIPADSTEGGYATYNMGVAMIRAGHTDDGITLLRSVMNLPPGEEETNALKDRSALAIGLTELKRENLDASRQALTRIRADGPFSNEALLALGLTNYRRGDHRKALPLWLELVRRNPGHGSVQEALMLAPRAYEELNALPQALAGYQFAAQTYREELKQVERAIRTIDNPRWLEQLKGTRGAAFNNRDPMTSNQQYSASGGAEMSYLYKLFASHSFNELFQQYLELDRIRNLLIIWRGEIPALEQTFALQQAQLQGVLPTVQPHLVQLGKQAQALSEQAAVLSSSIPNRLDMNHPEDLANMEQLLKWEKVVALESSLDGRGTSASTAQYRERLRRIRGVLLYNIAHLAQPNRELQFREAGNLVEATDLLAVRREAVSQLVKDATLHIRGNLGQQLSEKRRKVDKLIVETDSLIEKLGQILKNDALRVLAGNRRQLGDQLGEAHLSIARLQDVSVLEDISKGGAK